MPEKGEVRIEPKDHASFMDDQAGVDIVETFDEMPLNQLLLRGIYSHGFEKPSAIQQRAIVPMINGGDIIAQAQSGTGKTGAFATATLERMNFQLHNTLQALVLSPTRELAQQTHEVMTHLAQFLVDDTSVIRLFVGGTMVVNDIRAISSGCVIAVGTPGRMVDLLQRGALHAKKIKTFVLDEADELLSQGFTDQVYDVFRHLPSDVQVALFSATISQEVLKVSERFMRNPTTILVKKESLTLEGIQQYYVAMDENDKIDTLMELYESVSISQSVIFANTRQRVSYIAQKLNDAGYAVASIHAEMSREERENVMDAFRAGESRVLITTDLTARGIDVQHVNIVVNFNLPPNLENYLHRIGRSGRYGRKGIAINFVSQRDMQTLRNIESHYHTSIEELPQDFINYFA